MPLPSLPASPPFKLSDVLAERLRKILAGDRPPPGKTQNIILPGFARLHQGQDFLLFSLDSLPKEDALFGNLISSLSAIPQRLADNLLHYRRSTLGYLHLQAICAPTRGSVGKKQVEASRSPAESFLYQRRPSRVCCQCLLAKRAPSPYTSRMRL